MGNNISDIGQRQWYLVLSIVASLSVIIEVVLIAITVNWLTVFKKSDDQKTKMIYRLIQAQLK